VIVITTRIVGIVIRRRLIMKRNIFRVCYSAKLGVPKSHLA
jgi:hypothetical protein